MPASPSSSSLSCERVHLKRRLELHHAVAIIGGVIIGAGIYISPQSVLQHAGSPGAALICWAVSGVLAIISSLAMAELGTTYPASGDKYEYLLQMYGPYVGFLYLWIYLFLQRPGSSALKCLLFSRILLQMVYQDCPVDDRAVTILAIYLACKCVILYLNCLSVMSSARSQMFCTSCSVLALITITVMGLMFKFSEKGRYQDLSFQGSSQDVSNYVLAVYAGSFAYLGGDALNNMTEELKNPKRNLPLAIIISLTLVTVLYLLVNAAYLCVLPVEVMLESEAVAVTFSEKSMQNYVWVVPAFIAITLFGSCNTGCLVGSRICFAAARRDHMPGLFSLIHIDRKTPVIALIQQFIFLMIGIWISNTDLILTNVMSSLTLMYVLTSFGMLFNRWKQPQLERPIKMPMLILVLYFLSSLFLFVTPFILRPSSVAIGLMYSVGTGSIVYLIAVKWKTKPQCIHRYNVRFMMLIQKIMLCIQQEQPGCVDD